MKISSAFDLEDFQVFYLDQDITEKLNEKNKILGNFFGDNKDVNLKIQILNSQANPEDVDPEKQKLFDEIDSFIKENPLIHKEEVDLIFDNFFSEISKIVKEKFYFLKDHLVTNIDAHNNFNSCLKNLKSNSYNEEISEIYKIIFNYKLKQYF